MGNVLEIEARPASLVAFHKNGSQLEDRLAAQKILPRWAVIKSFQPLSLDKAHFGLYLRSLMRLLSERPLPTMLLT